MRRQGAGHGVAVVRETEQRRGDARRDETELERLDRNLEELNGELRVVVTGVQVLFAFLLIVPFDTGFAHVGGFERAVYLVTLLLAAMAAVCTIAPSAQHRWVFRHDDKRHTRLLRQPRGDRWAWPSWRSRCAAVCCSSRRSCSAPAGAR